VNGPTPREIRNSRFGRGRAVSDAIAVHGGDRDFKRQAGHGGAPGTDIEPRTCEDHIDGCPWYCEKGDKHGED